MSWIITGSQKNNWTPADITTALWLDGSDNSTIFSDAGITPATDGAAVRQWNDKSGNNRHVTQSTAGNRPEFTANSLNGRGSIAFADTSRWLLGAVGDESAFDFTSTLYVFFVGQIAASSGANVFINKGRATFSDTGWYGDINSANPSLIGITAPSSWSSVDAQGTIAANTDYIYSFEANGSTARARKNGTTTSTTVDAKASWVASANDETLLIGGYDTIPLSTNYEGIMRQIIVMPTVPSLAIIQKLEGWAAHYYGLTADLPADHPYKTAIPVP